MKESEVLSVSRNVMNCEVGILACSRDDLGDTDQITQNIAASKSCDILFFHHSVLY